MAERSSPHSPSASSIQAAATVAPVYLLLHERGDLDTPPGTRVQRGSSRACCCSRLPRQLSLPRQTRSGAVGGVLSSIQSSRMGFRLASEELGLSRAVGT